MAINTNNHSTLDPIIPLPTMWPPTVMSWFISTSNYKYEHHKPNSYWSYVHQLSYSLWIQTLSEKVLTLQIIVNYTLSHTSFQKVRLDPYGLFRGPTLYQTIDGGAYSLRHPLSQNPFPKNPSPT